MRALSRVAGAVERLARDARDFRRLRRSRLAQVAVDVVYAGGRLESIDVHADGTLAINGWTPNLRAFSDGLEIEHTNGRRSPSHVFRVSRPDIEFTARGEGFLGAVAEFVLDHDGATSILASGNVVARIAVRPGVPVPYANLRREPTVLGREHIYGHGPPVTHVSREVLQLAQTLPPPVLDFGCGAGALVAALRRHGVEAYGIELDDERIRSALLDEARPHVTRYHGTAPMPVADRSMASVIAAEVLEHIPDYRAALVDMARVARSVLLITVPDASAIPRCAAHGVVPWHLLEATHLNFFTQHSLEQMLAPLAREVNVAKIGLVRCDTTTFYTSLAAHVELR